MNFILKLPSLKHITLVKVAASLWNQHDIMALVAELSKSPLFSKFDSIGAYIPDERKQKWQSIENKVIEKMLQLIVPTNLKEEISGYIQTVGLQILQWVVYHLKFCDFDLNLMNEFCWTPQGTIDKNKTAEVLIRNDSIDIATRYKLARVYCLENGITELWNKAIKNFFTVT